MLGKCVHATIIHRLGQLENTASSLVYSGPCLIQIELAQCGLKPSVSVIIVAVDMEAAVSLVEDYFSNEDSRPSKSS